MQNKIFFSQWIKNFLLEDGIEQNYSYLHRIPEDLVEGRIHFKSDLILAGMPFFLMVFETLGLEISQIEKDQLMNLEGKNIKKGEISLPLTLPFSIALNGERLALNLLSRASAIATKTNLFRQLLCTLGNEKIQILDTRKTTPGLRTLEKYAVVVGGGKNHRFTQSDVWMIKDNHKNFFGSLEKAYEFFQQCGSFYNSLVAEIHSVEEFYQAKKLGFKHLMLDNLNPSDLQKILAQKEAGMSIELSGGINENNLHLYALEGVDAISLGALTHNPPAVDISFKYHRL